jgi:hypothetical protein
MCIYNNNLGMYNINIILIFLKIENMNIGIIQYFHSGIFIYLIIIILSFNP